MYSPRSAGSTRDMSYNAEDGILKIFLKGRPVNLYAPSDVMEEYDLNAVLPATEQQLSMQWAYPLVPKPGSAVGVWALGYPRWPWRLECLCEVVCLTMCLNINVQVKMTILYTHFIYVRSIVSFKVRHC